MSTIRRHVLDDFDILPRKICGGIKGHSIEALKVRRQRHLLPALTARDGIGLLSRDIAIAIAFDREGISELGIEECGEAVEIKGEAVGGDLAQHNPPARRQLASPLE